MVYPFGLQIFSSFSFLHSYYNYTHLLRETTQKSPPFTALNRKSTTSGRHTVSTLYIKSLGSSASLSTKMKSYLAPTYPMAEEGNRSLWSWEILNSFCEDILNLLPWLDLDGSLGESNTVLLLCDSWPHPEDVFPFPYTSWTHLKWIWGEYAAFLAHFLPKTQECL